MRLLETMVRHRVIDEYARIRISLTGWRFRIGRATV